MSKLSLAGGDSGIGEVLLHAPETDETRIYEFPDETGTFALREFDIRDLENNKANRAGDTFTGTVTFTADAHFRSNVTVPEPLQDNHAVTKQYVDDNITELSDQVNGDISTEIDNINQTIVNLTETLNNTIDTKLVLATTEEAIAGTNNTHLMTPATTKSAINDAVGKIDLSPYFLKTGGDISGNVTVSGTVRAQNFQSTSDRRLKDNFETLSWVLDDVTSFKVYRYNFKDNDQVKHIGLIAQDVMRFYPELVSKDAEGYYAIDYNGVTALLVETIKELKEEIKDLKAEIAELKE